MNIPPPRLSEIPSEIKEEMMNAIVRGNPHTIQLKSFDVSVEDASDFAEILVSVFFIVSLCTAISG